MYCTKCGKKLEDGEICVCTAQQPVTQPISQPVEVSPQPQKRRMTKGKITAIIVISAVVSFIVFLGIGFLIGDFLATAGGSEILEQIDAKYPDKDFISESNDTVSHGTITDNVYRNDWLNLQLKCPEGFTEADDDLYEEYTMEDSECVVYFIAEDGDEISIAIGDGAHTAPKEYSAYYHASLIPILEGQYSDAYGEDVEMKNIFDSVTVGGIEYLVSATYADHEESVVYCMLCAQVGDQLVEITIVTDTLDECTALINTLQGLAVQI